MGSHLFSSSVGWAASLPVRRDSIKFLTVNESVFDHLREMQTLVESSSRHAVGAVDRSPRSRCFAIGIQDQANTFVQVNSACTIGRLPRKFGDSSYPRFVLM